MPFRKNFAFRSSTRQNQIEQLKFHLFPAPLDVSNGLMQWRCTDMGDARGARTTCGLLLEQRDRAFERDVTARPELVQRRLHRDLRRDALAHQIAAVGV